MVRLLVSSLCAVSLATAAASCPGGAGTCAAAGAQDFAEDEVSALQLKQVHEHSADHHKCPPIKGCKSAQPIVDAVDSVGAITHAFANNKDVVNDIIANGKVVNWGAPGTMNDCVPPCGNDGTCKEGSYLKDCSAWSLLKTGYVPLAYNYPETFYSMHPVGFIVKLSDSIAKLVTRRTIIDSDTWQRTNAGMWVEDLGPPRTGGFVVDEWKANCPVWKQPYEDTNVVCVEETTYKNGCNDVDMLFEVEVGKRGELWPQQYMFKSNGDVDLSKHNTMLRQCSFKDQKLYQKTLKAFYAETLKLTLTPGNGITYPFPEQPPSGLFYDSEMNIQQPADTLLSKITPDLLAIVVQTTKCAESLAVMGKADAQQFCDGPVTTATGESEDEVIKKSIQAACLVSKQLGGVPVVNAKLPTNSMTQASWATWATAKKCECSTYCELDCKAFL